jgi:hypothetical protein
MIRTTFFRRQFSYHAQPSALRAAQISVMHTGTHKGHRCQEAYAKRAPRAQEGAGM